MTSDEPTSTSAPTSVDSTSGTRVSTGGSWRSSTPCPVTDRRRGAQSGRLPRARAAGAHLQLRQPRRMGPQGGDEQGPVGAAAAGSEVRAHHVDSRTMPAKLPEPSHDWAAVRAFPDKQAQVIALHYLETARSATSPRSSRSPPARSRPTCTEGARTWPRPRLRARRGRDEPLRRTRPGSRRPASESVDGLMYRSFTAAVGGRRLAGRRRRGRTSSPVSPVRGDDPDTVDVSTDE